MKPTTKTGAYLNFQPTFPADGTHRSDQIPDQFASPLCNPSAPQDRDATGERMRDATRAEWNGAERQSQCRVVSLFAGCGGMDLGFEQEGFAVVAANELCVSAIATYQANFPMTTMVSGDITHPDVKSRISAACGGHCDVVVGGFPCGPFSRAGQRNPKDPRARLFWDFLEMVRWFRPTVAVIENVQPLLSARNPSGGLVFDEIVTTFRRMGYEVAHRVLLAADYGVPQLRKRLFVIAARRGIRIRFPVPTHTQHPSLWNDGSTWQTLGGAIGDLIDAHENEEWSHRFTRHAPEVAARFASTPVGTKGTRKGDDGRAKYNEGYFRNPSNVPCVTIKTGAWPVHYALARDLTCREAARVQSFPDTFSFVGNKAAVATMIGNAVPPRLARGVAQAVRLMLDEARLLVWPNAEDIATAA